MFGPNGASRPASETTPHTPPSFRLWTIFSAVCLWKQLLYVVGIMSLTSHQLPDPMALPCQGKITASCLVRACSSLLHQPSLNPDIYPEAIALEKTGGHACPLSPCRQLTKRSRVMPWVSWSYEAPAAAFGVCPHRQHCRDFLENHYLQEEVGNLPIILTGLADSQRAGRRPPRRAGPQYLRVSQALEGNL